MRHDPPYLPSERGGVVLPRTPLLIGLACLLLGAGLATLARQQLDYPVVLWLNRFATRSALLDNVAHALTSINLLLSAALVAGIWLVWFDAPEPLARARVMAGVFAASLAALVSRGLELALPVHPRPLVDAALPFVLPLKVDPAIWKNWSSFPSDTASPAVRAGDGDHPHPSAHRIHRLCVGARRLFGASLRGLALSD